MALINLIQSNPIESTVTFVIILALILLVAKSKKAQLYAVALYLVSVADDEFDSKKGKLKFAKVYSAIKKELPVVTLFLPEKVLLKIIEEALDNFKAILKEKQEKEKVEEEEKDKPS